MNNNAYKVIVTRQAMEQLQEIVHYISKELFRYQNFQRGMLL